MLLVPSGTTAAPAVHITWPPSSILKFPPANLPTVLTPPVADGTFARPFSINPELYNNLLSVNYPITIAIVYATSVFLLNRYNAQRDHKPWSFSKTSAFFAFVIAHNVFLAIYSAWTFVGMINAIRNSWPSWHDDHGVAGVVDALCKINGPRGLGSAATYNSTTSSWGVTNELIKLVGGTPDNTDVGRIWNEGLAYYGWLFYVSKFYEVLDTMIILAKGKKSSFLQTYHHAGAMMCMWAGMRYMSPPIWMFVLINSFIHALMYSYYTFAALGMQAPMLFKRTLTGLQIAQFVFGASYAFAHLFISYSAPVNTPYLFTHSISTAIPAMTSSISSAIASVTASAGVGNLLKKIVLRAAGNEGLAENVHNDQGLRFGIDETNYEKVEKARDEIRYKVEYPTVNCIDTSGQAFAIMLNVMYLAPLTYLFVDFFIRSYSRRTSSSTKHPTHDRILQKSGHDAFKGVEREIYEAALSEVNDLDPEMKANLKKTGKNIQTTAQKGAENATAATKQGIQTVKEEAGPKYEEFKKETSEFVAQGGQKAKEFGSYVGEKVKEGLDMAKPKVKAAGDKISEVASNTGAKAREAAIQAKDKAPEVIDSAKDGVQTYAQKAKENAAAAKEKAPEVIDSAKDGAQTYAQKAKESAEAAKESAPEVADKVSKNAKQVANKASEKSKAGAETAGSKAKQGKENIKQEAGSASDKAKEGKENVKQKAESASEKAKQGKENVKQEAESASEKTKQGKENVKQEAESASEEAKSSNPQNDSSGEAANDADATSKSTLLDGDPSAYEVDFDEVESKEEKDAEKAFQPNGS
ncbi:hypothetical protein MMC27_008741 [Xylographa pallens]|nr:hypothetical protein [Xylographa pallens]